LIQSGEKERADLSGHSGRGHLVLVCAERRIPLPLLTVNRQRGCPAAQMGVAKSDFRVGADQILIENVERFTWISLDLSDFEIERNHYLL